MTDFSLYGCEEGKCLTLNQSGGALLHHHIPLKPGSSSTEPQTHSQLSVGCSLVIMPYSRLLNTLLSYLLHSQHPLRLLIRCSMPYRCTASAGPESLAGTKQTPSAAARATVAIQERAGIDGWVWTFNFCSPGKPRKSVDPDRWRLCHSFPSAHSPLVYPLEPEKHSSQWQLFQALLWRSADL